jgi:hypothetical protein
MSMEESGKHLASRVGLKSWKKRSTLLKTRKVGERRDDLAKVCFIRVSDSRRPSAVTSSQSTVW